MRKVILYLQRMLFPFQQGVHQFCVDIIICFAQLVFEQHFICCQLVQIACGSDARYTQFVLKELDFRIRLLE